MYVVRAGCGVVCGVVCVLFVVRIACVVRVVRLVRCNLLFAFCVCFMRGICEVCVVCVCVVGACVRDLSVLDSLCVLFPNVLAVLCPVRVLWCVLCDFCA